MEYECIYRRIITFGNASTLTRSSTRKRWPKIKWTTLQTANDEDLNDASETQTYLVEAQDMSVHRNHAATFRMVESIDDLERVDTLVLGVCAVCVKEPRTTWELCYKATRKEVNGAEHSLARHLIRYEDQVRHEKTDTYVAHGRDAKTYRAWEASRLDHDSQMRHCAIQSSCCKTLWQVAVIISKARMIRLRAVHVLRLYRGAWTSQQLQPPVETACQWDRQVHSLA